MGTILNNFTFYKKYDKQTRMDEFNRIHEKYPDRFPLIIEQGVGEKIKIERHKYLVQADITIGQLIYIIRKNVTPKIHEETALFLTFNETMFSTSKTIGEIYEDYKNKEDGFLYLNFFAEKTFG